MNKSIILALGILIVLLVAIYVVSDYRKSQGTELTPHRSVTQESTQAANISNECDGSLTPAQTEGPYYKSGSPQKNNIAEGVSGEKLTVTGFVFDKNCNPISGAWLDFWQADSNGNYDITGYKLRGHQFTNNEGQYRLETIIPPAYGSRPPHIHVKVRKTDNPILTSQLYFPNERLNESDSIFNEKLIIKITEDKNETSGQFNFILP